MTATAIARPNVRREAWRLRVRNARGFVRTFSRRRDGLIGLVILVLFAFLAIFPGLFVGSLETATTATGNSLESPGAVHLFGTDELGRDMLNLTIHGARISMTIGFLATIITVVFGALIGIVAGYVGGRLDAILMRLTDFFLVLPTFPLIIVFATYAGKGSLAVVVIVLILPPLAFLGFMFCLVYEKTGSIVPTIGLHAFNNTIASVRDASSRAAATRSAPTGVPLGR